MRTFKTGATRNNDNTKSDFEGFLSPLFLEEFGNYMTVHRKQADGTIRDSDNWQKGIPLSVYAKSLIRHVFSFWKLHRGYKVLDPDDGHEVTLVELCCAVLFNVQGYAHELLREENERKT